MFSKAHLSTNFRLTLFEENLKKNVFFFTFWVFIMVYKNIIYENSVLLKKNSFYNSEKFYFIF